MNKYVLHLVTAVAVVIGAVSGTIPAAASGPGVVGDGGYPGAGLAPAPGAAVTAAAQPSGYPVNGIDVSGHDYDNGRTINWPALAGGMEFAYVKATEGTSYVNPHYASDVSGAKTSGLFVGAYAYGRPDLGNATGQADHFVDTLDYAHDGRTLPPFLDMEWPYGDLHLGTCFDVSTATLTSWMSSFLARVESRLGVVPMIYTNVNWWNQCTGGSAAFSHYLLDISSCLGSPPSAPGWGTKWTFWQYDIPDCDSGLPHDADVFRGSVSDLAALAGSAPAPVPDGVATDVNADGRMEIFGRNANGGVMTAYQSSPNGTWSGWADLQGVNLTGRLATAANADERLQVFARNGNGGVMTNWQTAANGTFAGWTDLGGTNLVGAPAAGRNADGRIEIFVRNSSGHILTNWQTAANGTFSGWKDLGGSIVSDPAVVNNADGRMEIFARNPNGGVMTNYQAAANGTFSGWADLEGTDLVGRPAAGRNADGRIEIFVRNSSGHLLTNWQTAANGSFSGWKDLGGSIVSDPAVVNNADGRMEVFARNANGGVMTNYQAAANGTFSGWADLGGTNLVGTPAAGRNADGRIEIFVRNGSGHILTNWQTAANGSFSGWKDLGGAIT